MALTMAAQWQGLAVSWHWAQREFNATVARNLHALSAADTTSLPRLLLSLSEARSSKTTVPQTWRKRNAGGGRTDHNLKFFLELLVFAAVLPLAQHHVPEGPRHTHSGTMS